MQAIGILGGTFDPIHYGHIRLALEARKQINLDQVRLIPVNIPPHRTKPVASPAHRRVMIELAITDEPGLCIDLRELETDEISYTINTVKSLRQELVDDAIYLIIGRDAFNKINSWKNWQELLDYVHIIVASRPGEYSNTISHELKHWIDKHQTNDVALLKSCISGYIYFIDIPKLDMSSSMIRQSCSKHKNIEGLLPPTTLNYIKEKQLYMDTT